MNIRHTTSADLADIKRILDDTELFPADILDSMFETSQSKDPSEIWMTTEIEGRAVAFCYAAPEPLTDGTWNMLAIGVRGDRQGDGIGGELTRALESQLRADGHRILIADTSGAEDFARTRAFYRKQGYTEESRIRDFWAAGDDKVTFRKALQD